MQRVLFALAVLVLVGFVADSGATATAAGKPVVFSAVGVGNVQGRDTLVHVAFLTVDGANASEHAVAALAAQGARPIERSDYVLFDSKWPASGGGTGPAQVEQHYNDNNEPTSANGTAGIDMEAA